MRHKDGFSRWLQFALGVAGIGLFIFVLAPLLQTTAPVHDIHEQVRIYSLNGGALFYSEISEPDYRELGGMDNDSLMPDSAAKVPRGSDPAL